ncbi:transglycosylase SLT domain-containing protein [Tranquillimonas alkanivorans]|nr:transglycosylase SLT domain-containing protein [Tranquillimonas alkanivorans]
MRRLLSIALVAGLALPAAASEGTVRPKPRPEVFDIVPVARWDFRPEGQVWSRSAMQALQGHGRPLVELVPRDITDWCPGYERAPEPARASFWVGFMSALAKHESTWRPTAVGGGGKWYGLLQILPATARGYGCRARTGSALKDGAANLSCAIRIMARTVRRDGVIHARSPKWSGVSADWGPMRSDTKRREMASWLRQQDYCQMHASPRPMPRPAPEALVAGPVRPVLQAPPRPADFAPKVGYDVAQTDVLLDLPTTRTR